MTDHPLLRVITSPDPAVRDVEHLTADWVHWYNTSRLMHRLGLKPLIGGKSDQGRLILGKEIENPRQEPRVRRCGTQGARAEPGQRQEAAQPLRSAGDEAERGNGDLIRIVTGGLVSEHGAEC